jgi:hypothetical protein
MTILLTEKEMLDLAYDYLNILPNPDNAHQIAEKMDMKYIEFCGLYWDVEEISLRKIQRSGDPY